MNQERRTAAGGHSSYVAPSAPKIFMFLVFFGIGCTFFIIRSGIHQVEEGHVGVYWRGGALLDGISSPGYHVKLPLVTQFANVQITLQTDVVQNIPCGTSGGVVIYFDKIEVVNRLQKEHAHHTIKYYGTDYDKIWIFDKIHHEINQFCSSHSLQEVYIDDFDTLDEALAEALQESCDKFDTGIEIIAIRVTKPRIPESVRKNYELVAEEKTKLLVAVQHQEVVTKEEETKLIAARVAANKEREVAVINANKEAEVHKINANKEAESSLIKMEMKIKEQEALQKQESIKNAMHSEKSKSEAEARSYAITLEAEALKLKLTPEYLKSILYESLSSNSKIYYGPSIPNIFLDWFANNDLTDVKKTNVLL